MGKPKPKPIWILHCAAGHDWPWIHSNYTKGHFDRFPKYCPEHREEARIASISAARQANDRQRIENQAPLPDKWKCTKCGLWKPISEFRPRKKQLKNGLTTVYPDPCCGECDAKRSADYKKRMMAEQPELYRERRRKISARNNRKQRKKSQRLVDAAPFVEWWNGLAEKPDIDFKGSLYRRITSATSGQSKRISLWVVDEVAVRADQPHITAVLYGDSREV